MYALVDEDRDGLVLRRVWPWHRMVARSRAGRLDRELAAGTSPEASAILAARAAQLTSTGFRRDLAASLRRMLVAAGQPAWPVPTRQVPVQWPRSPYGAACPVRVPLRASRVSRTAPLLAELAGRLLEPGPVPVRGVAMVNLLLTDGTGPLYREASRADLSTLAHRAAYALSWQQL